MRRSLLVGALLVLVPDLAACDRGPGPQPTASPTVSPGASSGVMPLGATFDSLAPCREATDPRLPKGAGCAVAAEGDLDGDRRADSVISYAVVGPDGRAARWLLRAVLAAGEVAEVEVDRPYQFAVLGTADLDGDGRHEVFARVEQGASTEFAGIFTLDDRGRLTRVAEDGKGPLQFAYSGSVTHGDGGSCTRLPDGRPGLVIRQVERLDESQPYRWRETDYEWLGNGAVGVARTRQGAIDAADGRDARLAPFFEFTCGGLRLP
ncbi:MAG: FG-GAP repeat domain-containing protein [Actinomycetota bacterium]